MKAVRQAMKQMIIKRGGVDKVLNRDITEIENALNVSYMTVRKALDYFCYSPQQKAFRETF